MTFFRTCAQSKLALHKTLDLMSPDLPLHKRIH